MEQEFKAVVRRIYEVAKEHYDNNIQEHIQAIYNRLSDHEQNTFLKNLIPYIFDVEKPPKPVRESIHLEYDEFDIQTYNQIEMIRLKSWVVKCSLIALSSSTILFLMNFLVRSIMGEQSMELVSELFEFLKLVMSD